MGGESALEGARSFVGTQVTPPFSLGAHLVLHMLLTPPARLGGGRPLPSSSLKNHRARTDGAA